MTGVFLFCFATLIWVCGVRRLSKTRRRRRLKWFTHGGKETQGIDPTNKDGLYYDNWDDMRKNKIFLMVKLSIIAIVLTFSSCKYSKEDITRKFETDFSNKETDFLLARNKSDSLYNKWKITNTISLSANYEESSIIFQDNRTVLFNKIDSVVDDDCKFMVLNNLNLMRKLNVDQISSRDSSVLFSLKESSISFNNDIYIYYTIQQVPMFQEINLNILVSPEVPNRWAYKLKDNWFLVVLQKNV